MRPPLITSGPVGGSQWTHVKSGHDYMVVCCGFVEATLQEAVVYRRYPDIQGDPRIWITPVEEFLDGRFKRKKVEFKP